MGGYFNIFSLKQAVAVIICNLLSLCLASAWVPTWPSSSYFGSFGHPSEALPQSNCLLCHSGRGEAWRLFTPAAFQGLLGRHGDLTGEAQGQGLPLTTVYHQVAKTWLPLSRVLTEKEGRNLSSYWLSSPGFKFYLGERKAGHVESSILPFLFTFPPRCLQW